MVLHSSPCLISPHSSLLMDGKCAGSHRPPWITTASISPGPTWWWCWLSFSSWQGSTSFTCLETARRPICEPTASVHRTSADATTSFDLAPCVCSREHSAGPLHLLAWIRNPDTIAFSPAYLRLWGARYAQDLADGQFYRWYSSSATAQDAAT